MRKILLRPVINGVWGPKWAPKSGMFEHCWPSVLVVRVSNKKCNNFKLLGRMRFGGLVLWVFSTWAGPCVDLSKVGCSS